MSRTSPLRLLVPLILVVAYSAPAWAACTSVGTVCTNSPSGAAGSVEWVCTADTIDKFQYYDGSSWLDFPISSTTGTQCGVAGTQGPGAFKYGNKAAHPSSEHDFEYCDNTD